MRTPASVTCALIACSKRKNKGRDLRAADLYSGEEFLVSMRYARKVLETRHFGILSPEYKLVWPRVYVEPYDVSLAEKTESERVQWAREVIQILNQTSPQTSKGILFRFVVLAEDLYADPLRKIGLKASYPLRGMDKAQRLAFLTAHEQTSVVE